MTYTQIFTASLSRIPQTWKLIRMFITEWINGDVATAWNYCSAVWRQRSHGSRISETCAEGRSQTQRNVHFIIPLRWSSKTANNLWWQESEYWEPLAAQELLESGTRELGGAGRAMKMFYIFIWMLVSCGSPVQGKAQPPSWLGPGCLFAVTLLPRSHTPHFWHFWATKVWEFSHTKPFSATPVGSPTI